MLQDFYHKTRLGVSALMPYLPVMFIAALCMVAMIEPSVAQTKTAVTKEALVTKGTTVSDNLTTFIRDLGKPIGTVIFVILALVMTVRGKQIIAQFGWLIGGLILAVMGASVVAVIWSIAISA
ncbi:TrbC/VirB2 family protein [Thalassospira xiamenensis]|uniref:TrbC/VirB2 family protein n=1 Tax=Thalassospira xiamenensis TaxID=220697 RepID=UPI000E066842|nr:TrbC/VirB2 family protein [Thalassospira xiamenensis]RCK37294.1 hypothetical protein TH24_17140 [Thalassospira xiamenensis]